MYDDARPASDAQDPVPLVVWAGIIGFCAGLLGLVALVGWGLFGLAMAIFAAFAAHVVGFGFS